MNLRIRHQKKRFFFQILNITDLECKPPSVLLKLMEVGQCVHVCVAHMRVRLGGAVLWYNGLKL